MDLLKGMMLIIWQLMHSPLVWAPLLIATILGVLWIFDRVLGVTINLNRFRE